MRTGVPAQYLRCANDSAGRVRATGRAHRLLSSRSPSQTCLFFVYPCVQYARVVDVGAAPGGWSSFMADHSTQVIAVDPAEMDPRVLQLPNVTHLSMSCDACVLMTPFTCRVRGLNNVFPISMAPSASMRGWLAECFVAARGLTPEVMILWQTHPGVSQAACRNPPRRSSV